MGLYIKVSNDRFEPMLKMFYLGGGGTISNTNYNCFKRMK